jgi:SAM-dependent methyltransferase
MDERMRWDEAAGHVTDATDVARDLPQQVLYSPWAAGESRLQLLGDLAGRRVLDLGCGSGENAVAMAEAGAEVTGLDISPKQIDRARGLAAARGVSIDFRCGDMHDAAIWDGLRCDLILATYVLPYSRYLDTLLGHCRSALAPGGMLVAAMDHPLRACFWDDESGELAAYPLRDYHARASLRWCINETWVEYCHRPISEWVDAFTGAALSIARIVEPMPTGEMVAAYWPVDSALEPLAHISHAVIFVAK